MNEAKVSTGYTSSGPPLGTLDSLYVMLPFARFNVPQVTEKAFKNPENSSSIL